MANLSNTKDTSVKFYASLTRLQAKGLAPIDTNKETGADIYVEPGAICFVSDSDGNSIFLNNLLFGDGATAGSVVPGGGTGGGGTPVELKLSNIVVVEKDGQPLKTLADYFNQSGTFITEGLKIISTATNGEGGLVVSDHIVMDKTGITINGKKVLVEGDAPSGGTYITESAAQELINAGILDAKAYADSLLGSIYRFKGSVDTYSKLILLPNPENGDVYNVAQAYTNDGKTIPAGTNFAYVKTSESTGYWDALGGSVDLSAYITDANARIAIGESLLQAKSYADGLKTTIDASIKTNSDLISSLTTRTGLNESDIILINTKLNLNSSNITANTNNINLISTLLTWQ